MWTFLTGVVFAMIVALATYFLYQAGEITAVERSSPSAYVRIDDKASLTKIGAGYGNYSGEPDNTEAGTATRD
ncbi:MAG: hypothetical protein KKB37_08040 [Alphaproteobacteria bacterium]|nr:hypothetical protein [Alphaproteobacteria bacterium]